MHITKLTAENVKRLQAVRIEPKDGALVVIGGANGQGKTSILDSIAMALGGKDAIPAKPIRDGEIDAQIIIETGEYTITRKFTASGTSLVVTGKDGKIASPQTLLETLASKISFDPLAFTRQKPADQADTLRTIAQLDFTKLDQESARIYAERTALGRDIKTLAAVLNTMPEHEDVGTELKDSAAILDRLTKATETNAANEKARSAVDDANDAISSAETRLVDVHGAVLEAKRRLREAEELEAKWTDELAATRKKRDELAEKMNALVDVDVAGIKSELYSIETDNEKVRANLAREEKSKAVLAKQSQADDITARLEEIESDKKKQLRKAKLPIEGLGFAGIGVTFNGVPFDQASAAEQLRVSVAMGAAMMPKLKIALIRDGSLLDDKSLALLGQYAEEHGVQVWIERVGEGAECSIIIEDGEVKETRPAKKAAK